MPTYYCHTKDKRVNIYQEQIPAPTFENPHESIPGRYICTGNNFQCIHDENCILMQLVERE